MVVRGDDQQLRAFHNVCRHRGSRVLTEERGRIVRFQCPYHAWTYDLTGSLQRAAHTDELIDFEPEHNGLVPVRLTTWLGFVFLTLNPDAAAARGPARRPGARDRAVPGRRPAPRAGASTMKSAPIGR